MSVNEVRLGTSGVDLEVRGTGHAGSRTFVIGDEDHTLGNSLRHVLMQNRAVEFAGYSVPHPSEPVVHIRVQTNQKVSAAEALREACQTLHDQCAHVLSKLEETVPSIRQDRIQMEEWRRREEEAAAAEEEEEDDGQMEGDYDDMDQEEYGDEA